MDYCNKQRILTTMTGLCVSAATGFLAIAVSTDYWLFTSEKNEDGNETASPTYTHVYSGLWHRCQYEEANIDPPKCLYIMYFTSNDDTEGLGPTEAILLNIRRATLFPLVSLLILFVSSVMCFIGLCQATRNVLTFVSGIFFVLAGLCTLVGIVLYIGSITEEVGNQPRAPVEEPKFIYSYGFSFALAVGSFILTELSGVFAVHHYIAHHKREHRKKVYGVRSHHTAMKESRDRNQWNSYRHATSECLRYDNFAGYNDETSYCRPDSLQSSSYAVTQMVTNSRSQTILPSSRSDTYVVYSPMSEATQGRSSYGVRQCADDDTVSLTPDLRQLRSEPYAGCSNTQCFDIVRRTTPV